MEAEVTTESQNEQILKYLQSGKSLTPIEALEKFGCFRAAARVKDLRRAGHNILTEMLKKNGKRFAKYYLIPPAE